MRAFIDTEIPWYVVRTNIKCEEKAFLNLMRAGFRDVYFPRRLTERINQRTHIRRRYSHPLMPRYLFLGLRHSDFGVARNCEGVEHILCEEGRSGKPVVVPAEMVQEIFLAERNMEFDETKEARAYRGENFESKFPKGAPVIVRKVNHLLSGFEGRVHSTNGKDRVKVDTRLGRVEFSAEDVDAA